MAGFLLAPCGNVHLVEMCRQGKTGCRYEGEKKYGLICMEGEMDYQSMFTFMLGGWTWNYLRLSWLPGAYGGAQRGMDISGSAFLEW